MTQLPKVIPIMIMNLNYMKLLKHFVKMCKYCLLMCSLVWIDIISIFILLYQMIWLTKHRRQHDQQITQHIWPEKKKHLRRYALLDFHNHILSEIFNTPTVENSTNVSAVQGLYVFNGSCVVVLALAILMCYLSLNRESSLRWKINQNLDLFFETTDVG